MCGLKFLSQKITFEPDKHEAIVRVVNPNRGSCSAFVIDNKRAITAAHCLATRPDLENPGQLVYDSQYFIVFNSKGKDTSIRVTVARALYGADAAILYGDFSKFEKLELARGFKLEAGEALSACGYPGGFSSLECTDGKFVRTTFFEGLMTNYIAVGMSGGPVMTKGGLVVGVNVRTTAEGYSAFPVLFGKINMEK